MSDLPRHPGEELQVRLEGVDGVAPAGADEVADVGGGLLAVAVDAADPLLEPVRVERDVVVDQAVAVALQVDALAGGVGGEQDADRVLGRVGLERQPQLLALVGGDAAVQLRRSRAGHALLAQQRGKPELRVAVLGEHDHALVGPVPPSGPADSPEVGDQLAGLRVGLGLVGERPVLHAAEQVDLRRAGRRVGLQRAGPVEASSSVCGSGLVVEAGGVVEELVEPLVVLVPLWAYGRARTAVQGLQVDPDGVREGGRAGEQPLLEQQRDQVDGLAAAGGCARLRRSAANSASSPWTCALALGVLDGDRRRLPLDEPGLPSAFTMSRLSRRTTVSLDGLRVRVHPAGEALVVEDLQQRGERRLVAVVRRRRQEQPVGEVRREPADQLGLLRVDGVDLLRRGGGDVVRLVEDQQVEGSRGIAVPSGGSTSSSSRCASAPRSQGRLTMVSGKTANGLAAEPACGGPRRTARSRRR